MAIDIHPAIVHIPVAFLSMYSLFEIARFKRLRSFSFWEPVKGIMLVIGTAGSIAALITGVIASQNYVGTQELTVVQVHAVLANLTILYFGVLSLVYLSHFAKDHLRNKSITRVTVWLDRVYDRIIARWPAILVGLVGFALITIVGALGGAIAYGPEADPMVSFVYHLFF